MKIGLFGGTFNPFHNGHIQISRHVQTAYALDRIFFIPSAVPPHKPDHNLAPAACRLRMVTDSIQGLDGFFVSDRELLRTGPSFTIDTIQEFKRDQPRADFYFMMGSDAFLDITTWKHTDQIFKTVKIIVMLRGEWADIDMIISFVDENLSKGYSFNYMTNVFSHSDRYDIAICRVPKIDISSSMIRDRIKQCLSIKGLVPAPVENLIRERKLYR